MDIHNCYTKGAHDSAQKRSKHQDRDRIPTKSHALGNFTQMLAIKMVLPGPPGPSDHLQGVSTVQKALTYTLLLAAALGLAACEKTAEDKMKSAQESAAEAVESMGDAVEQSAEAAADKVDEVLGNEPTTGEKIEEAAENAGEAIEEAGEKMKDAVDGE